MTCYEGRPHPYDRKKKMVVPQALKVLRLKPHRKYCKLGDLANSVGWKYQKLVGRLEEARSIKNKAYHKRCKDLLKVKKSALKSLPKATVDTLTKVGLQ